MNGSIAVERVDVPFKDYRLAGELHIPSHEPSALVVISHGFYSSKDSGKLTNLSVALAKAGYAVIRFDHLGCGESPGDFNTTTISGRGREILAAASVMRRRFGENIPLVLAGSSMGGSAAVMAGEEACPACLALWSAPIDLTEMNLRFKDEPGNGKLGALADETETLDLKSKLARIPGVLFVHGEKDEVVPLSHALHGHEAAAGPKGLLIIPAADHRFTDKEHQKLATKRTLAWIEEMLARS